MTDRQPSVLRRAFREFGPARQAVIRFRLLARKHAAPGGVTFLFYHGITGGQRAAFNRQLTLLRGFGDVTGLGAAITFLAGPATGERRICLTFDDGDRSAFDHAFPVLVERGLRAAFFVVPEWLDTLRPGTIGWQECRSLAQAGMEVGSHGLTHRRLSEIDGDDALTELSASRARIEAELGQPCLHFACPWGQPVLDYRPRRDPVLARAAGYRSFFTTFASRAAFGADPWALPRVRMEPGWGKAELAYALRR